MRGLSILWCNPRVSKYQSKSSIYKVKIHTDTTQEIKHKMFTEENFKKPLNKIPQIQINFDEQTKPFFLSAIFSKTRTLYFENFSLTYHRLSYRLLTEICDQLLDTNYQQSDVFDENDLNVLKNYNILQIQFMLKFLFTTKILDYVTILDYFNEFKSCLFFVNHILSNFLENFSTQKIKFNKFLSIGYELCAERTNLLLYNIVIYLNHYYSFLQLLLPFHEMILDKTHSYSLVWKNTTDLKKYKNKNFLLFFFPTSPLININLFPENTCLKSNFSNNEYVCLSFTFKFLLAILNQYPSDFGQTRKVYIKHNFDLIPVNLDALMVIFFQLFESDYYEVLNPILFDVNFKFFQIFNFYFHYSFTGSIKKLSICKMFLRQDFSRLIASCINDFENRFDLVKRMFPPEIELNPLLFKDANFIKTLDIALTKYVTFLSVIRQIFCNKSQDDFSANDFKRS